MHRLLCQITDQLFSTLVGPVGKFESDPSIGDEITAITDSIMHEDAYASVLFTISPLMAPPSVPLNERRDLLKSSFTQWEEAVQATSHARAVYLRVSLQQARSRRQRLDSVSIPNIIALGDIQRRNF